MSTFRQKRQRVRALEESSMRKRMLDAARRDAAFRAPLGLLYCPTAPKGERMRPIFLASTFCHFTLFALGVPPPHEVSLSSNWRLPGKLYPVIFSPKTRVASCG